MNHQALILGAVKDLQNQMAEIDAALPPGNDALRPYAEAAKGAAWQIYMKKIMEILTGELEHADHR